jgi:hypothetical protein
MKKRKRTRFRKCLFCEIKFKPGPHNRHHQKYCGRVECQRASHRASSKRYRKKKSDDADFMKNEVKRATAWRKEKKKQANSQKAKKVEKKSDSSGVLRDFVRGEKSSKEEVLRDFLLFYMYCFNGLASQLTGALRDDIVSLRKHCYDRGRALFPELEQELNEGVFAHGAKGNYQSGATASTAGGVWVGRSPPGT